MTINEKVQLLADLYLRKIITCIICIIIGAGLGVGATILYNSKTITDYQKKFKNLEAKQRELEAVIDKSDNDLKNLRKRFNAAIKTASRLRAQIKRIKSINSQTKKIVDGNSTAIDDIQEIIKSIETGRID